MGWSTSHGIRDVGDEVTVTFAPAGVTVRVAAGTTLIDAARSAGVLIASPCAGRGVCAGCGVRVISGTLEAPDEVEARALQRAPEGIRLACRARIEGPVEVRPMFSAHSQTPAKESGGGLQVSVAGARIVAGVDLGTTTVAALLVDADSGREIARAVVPNRQASSGADVLSRISAALSGEGEALQKDAEDSVVAALEAASSVAGVELGETRRVVIAGNSAMTALLSGADVLGLAAHPFAAPEVPDQLALTSAVRRLLPSSADVWLVPPMASFVGGDALAASLSAGLVDVRVPTLLVDIGTNAELILALPGRTLVASAAAGPAFEGAGLASGGPATLGAVERVEIEGENPVLHVIGGVEASWLSGAGFVSAVAALLAAGHVPPNGAMNPHGPLAARFTKDDAGVTAVVLSTEGSPLVRLTQLDVRALQLAKAAVRVGIETVLRHAGISAADLGGVFVAGAFGAALDPGDLVALGVLPSNVEHRARRLGNASLDGAAAIALDPALLGVAREFGADIVHVDLASDAGFNAAFISATEFAPYVV
jgi:uncharacterized 2Fe-2S/4Fe-4S cluster protein (DUF4445 family)